MKRQFILCIDDGGYPESLEKRKFYEVLPDAEAAKENLVRDCRSKLKLLY